MANILDILTRAQALRQETALNSITPDRAGGIMYDTLILINQMQLEGGSLLISKVYSSVAAMEADTTPTSDLTGRALRPGQLAVIVPSSSSSSDMGSVYRYNEPGSWTLCGKIGGLPLDTAPIQGSSNGITSGAVYTALSALRNEGYKYMGIATPGSGGTAPGTPNQPVFYIAGPGSYPNFGSITVASGYLGFIKYSGGSWSVESVAVGKDYDEQISQLQQEVTADISQLEHKVNQSFTGFIGVGNSNSTVTPENLGQYTGQHGTITLNVNTPLYLWLCMENDGWGADSCGIEIPMQYVGIISGYYCWVSEERVSGAVRFTPVKRHKVKSDSERIVIAANSYTITYGDAIPTFGYTANGDVEGTPAISCQATSESGAGTYEIVISRGTVTDDNAVYENGTLTIQKATLVVTADDKFVGPNQQMPSFTVKYSGFVNSDDEGDLTTEPSCTTNATDTATVGNYNIIPSGGVSSNYDFTYVNGVLTVGLVLEYTDTQLSNSGSCGGFIGNASSNLNKFKTSTQYYGILIDVRQYKGMTLRMYRRDGAASVRFAFLTASALTNDSYPSFSSATGYTEQVSYTYSGTDEYDDFTIPSDTNYMYLYVFATGTGYVGCKKMQFVGNSKPDSEMKNLTASLFSTNTTVNPNGSVNTSAEWTIATGYLTANDYAYLGVMKFLANAYGSGVDHYEANIAYYDANQTFISRDSYYAVSENIEDAHAFILPPSCSKMRILITQDDAEGNYLAANTIRFDNDDLQCKGTDNS